MSDSRDNVVFLKFRPTEAVSETIEVLACGTCRNKTYTVVYHEGQDYPTLKCAACGHHIGKIGWADEDEDQT